MLDVSQSSKYTNKQSIDRKGVFTVGGLPFAEETEQEDIQVVDWSDWGEESSVLRNPLNERHWVKEVGNPTTVVRDGVA